jgi:hypothetical protein
VSPRTRRTLAASAVLATVLAVLADAAMLPSGTASDPGTTLPPKPALAPKEGQPLDAYAEIADRPLFQPSRRPASPPPPSAAPVIAEAPAPAPKPAPLPPPPPTLSPVTLLAVAISAERREAVLGLPGGKSSTMAEGDSLEGWVLAKVLPDRVVFRTADIEKEVTFPVGQSGVRPASGHPLKNPTPPTQRPH